MTREKKKNETRRICISGTTTDATNGMILKHHSIDVESPDIKEIERLFKKAMEAQKDLGKE